MSLLSPIEGITVEQWANAQAKVASGGSVDEVISALGIDAPKWDRVNSEWMARMSNDTTFELVNIYSAAFNPAASGNLGAGSTITKDEGSLELYAEAMAAQEILGNQGQDAQSVLEGLGLTVADYSNLGAKWSGQMLSDVAFATKFDGLLNKYKAKYEGACEDAHDDLVF